jgi:hypothetical protein
MIRTLSFKNWKYENDSSFCGNGRVRDLICMNSLSLLKGQGILLGIGSF